MTLSRSEEQNIYITCFKIKVHFFHHTKIKLQNRVSLGQ